jgi:arsenite methyltransferase
VVAGLDLDRAVAAGRGNNGTSTERNAWECVAERIELVDADAPALPFPAGSFNVVASNLTLHNTRSADERAQALGEAAWVLRPGGQLRMVRPSVCRLGTNACVAGSGGLRWWTGQVR